MGKSHSTPPHGPAVLGVAILVVGAALLGDQFMATLTATPFWRVVSVAILLGFLYGLSFWMVSTIRALGAGNGGGD